MREETVLTDSAGHTMIDIGATRPPERDRTPEAETAEEDKKRAKSWPRPAAPRRAGAG